VSKQSLPKEFLARLKGVEGKRPRTVIEHILKHGHITTEELRTKYGYDHPPRAARDVREQGIPLETFRVKNSEGRSIGAYRFADPSGARFDKLGGRKVFHKEFKEELINLLGCRCSICLEKYEDRYLQVDHRTPYEVSGDSGPSKRRAIDYMLLCGSCNRAKSWSCEHCLNWIGGKDLEVCGVCYWAAPESYAHIAMKDIRRLDVVWTGAEVKVYETLKKRAARTQEDMPDYVKRALRRHIQEHLDDK
jgi:hypothetical protein